MATTYTFAVTFEFHEQAPETVRGQIAAHTAQTAASRALKQARKAKPKARPAPLWCCFNRLRRARLG
jgi:hypothetical protein